VWEEVMSIGPIGGLRLEVRIGDMSLCVHVFLSYTYSNFSDH
jgi:hypothetical protein